MVLALRSILFLSHPNKIKTKNSYLSYFKIKFISWICIRHVAESVDFLTLKEPNTITYIQHIPG